MTRNVPPTTLVIFGITGDLASRKLLPALQAIAKAGFLPQHFTLIGVSRKKTTPEEILGDTFKELAPYLKLHSMNMDDVSEYHQLIEFLPHSGQHLFYLSIPPQIAEPVINHLGKTKIAASPSTKLLLEKPFGVDLDSANELAESIKTHFREEQVYRIDHYLAKEMVQNFLVFRASNSLFRRSWNNKFIESIHITATEKIGIEGRVSFYEQTGALRDIVQSHLLQLAALVLMDLPAHDNWSEVPAARLKALKQIIPPVDITKDAFRAQYDTYRTEVKNADTTTETFCHITLFSKDPKFEHVPIVLTTGKSLDKKITEIKLRYKQDGENEANTLVFRIQPDEAIEVHLLAKKPGYEHVTETVHLSFPHNEHFKELPEAYEQVFVDAMRGNHHLFTTSDEVLASWAIVEPIQKAWGLAPDILLYEKGSSPEKVLESLESQLQD